MKIRNIVKKFAPKVILTAGMAGSFAANASVDVGDAVTVIATGLAAIGAMGAAYLGLTVLKKVWGKIGGS
ncbi:hypothetical protein [Vibrio nigripulchritudo]|uniref:hypothetical protein n=1 Tax=Vibrio nigripulchritudo TaxID=28173 RepID=UPI0024903F90|nr:hypothetical protein [Vibrio nigripulchritudo]BDU37175.1 hypothetical protein TUMSATVNIG2_16440 [Vibrio nigripulchritudo]